MKFGVVNKSTILNRFVHHTLQRKITHLAVITRKSNIKLGILKGGTGKEPDCSNYIIGVLLYEVTPKICIYFSVDNRILSIFDILGKTIVSEVKRKNQRRKT